MTQYRSMAQKKKNRIPLDNCIRQKKQIHLLSLSVWDRSIANFSGYKICQIWDCSLTNDRRPRPTLHVIGVSWRLWHATPDIFHQTCLEHSGTMGKSPCLPSISNRFRINFRVHSLSMVDPCWIPRCYSGTSRDALGSSCCWRSRKPCVLPSLAPCWCTSVGGPAAWGSTDRKWKIPSGYVKIAIENHHL